MGEYRLPEAGAGCAARLAVFLAMCGCAARAYSDDLQAIPLTNSVTVTGHVTAGANDLSVTGSTVFYKVELQDPATQVLEVRMAITAGDADLYGGTKMSFNVADYSLRSTHAGLKGEGGWVDRTSNPPITTSTTWYFAVHGYDATDYFLIASWGNAGAAAPLQNGQPVEGQVREGFNILVYPGSTLYYTVDIGDDAQRLAVTLNSNAGDADLFLGRELSASPSVYDASSIAEGNADDQIVLDPTTHPTPGESRVWYIAVHGYVASTFTLTATWSHEALQTSFLRGDCNGDHGFDISDAVAHLGALYQAGTVPCIAACDSNGDGMSDISDPIYSLIYLFQDGSHPPPAPFPVCGPAAPVPVLPCLMPSC